MSGGKHTAGPWKVSLKRGKINGADIVNERAELIVHMPQKADRPIYQKEADAHLIAAAPTMYEALQEAIQLCASCNGTGTAHTHPDETEIGQPPGSSAVKCPECFAMRSAISKAQGRP